MANAIIVKKTKSRASTLKKVKMLLLFENRALDVLLSQQTDRLKWLPVTTWKEKGAVGYIPGVW